MNRRRNMRLHWRHFVCYSFFLTVLALHVFLRYAVVPESELKGSGYPSVPHDHSPCEDCPASISNKNQNRDMEFIKIRDLQARYVDIGEGVRMSQGGVYSPGGGVTGEEGQEKLVYYPNTNVEVNLSVNLTKPASENAQQSMWTSNNQPQILRYPFSCSNVDQIQIKRKLGQGVTKQVYLGIYDGRKIAVKMVTRNVIDVMSCMKNKKRDALGAVIDKHKCYTLPNMKLMKEILLLHQLEHPNLLKLLGYCVRSEETESTSLQEHGIVAVYEYGLRFYVSSLRDWPWKLRLRTALELADLLDYLQHSSLGSMRISDFKDAHFLLKDGKIKLTDLDDVTSLEPSCRPPMLGMEQDSSRPVRMCAYDLKCIGGICPGYNAKKNLDNFSQLFFKNLLIGDTYDIESQLTKVRTRLDNLTLSAGQLKEILYKFMDVPYIPGYS